MNILLIEKDSTHVAEMTGALTDMDPTIEFCSCISADEALSKLSENTLVPDVIYFSFGKQNQKMLTFLRRMKERQNHVIIFCLVESVLTDTDINAFGSLGVHYFVDRNLFFKKLKEILTTVQKTLCMARNLGV
jgi:hypothetical protein